MEKRAKTLATRDWAGGLPPDLLASVLDHLTAGDHARFAAVCASWRSVAREARRRPAPQAPWVLLSPPFYTEDGGEDKEDEEEEDDDEGTHGSFHFMRPHDGKVHTIRRRLLPEFRWKRVVGISPDGWLTIANKRGELRALNPLTGDRIRLPRMATVPKGYSKKCTKAVMSSPYARQSCSPVFMVLLDNGRQKRVMALARAGDKKWSLLDTAALAGIYDFAYHKGEFYILGGMRVGGTGEEVICIAIVGFGGLDLSSPPEVMVVGPMCRSQFGHRLAGSTSGELLLVFSSISADYGFCRLDVLPNGDGGRVVRSVQLGDLGDHALLLAQECSILVSTSQVPELRRNCVYSIYKFYQHIFNLEDRSTKFQSANRCIEAAWFMPGVL